MKIGYDLDGIFIDGPPFIPRGLLEWLYRGPQNHEPKYRFPSTRLEQKIRKWSHQPIFRPQISKNAEFLKTFSDRGNHQFFLISSRYKFLENETLDILKKYGLRNHFLKIYLNDKNEQPHLFKKRILENLNLDIFIEDDLMLLSYLQKFFPKCKLLWYNPNNVRKSYAGITRIKNLKELQNYLK